MTKDELIAEITMLREIIVMGHDRLAENQYIDMNVMQSKVEAACQEVAEMSPEEATDVRQALTELLEDLQNYSTNVSKHIDQDSSTGGGTGSAEG